MLCLFSKVSALCCSPTKSHLQGFSCLCITPPHSFPFAPVQHGLTQASPTCHQGPDKCSPCPFLSDLCTNVTSQRKFSDYLLHRLLSPLLSTMVDFASRDLIDVIAYIYLSKCFNYLFNTHFFQMRILWFCLLHGSHSLVLLGVYFIFMTKDQLVSTQLTNKLFIFVKKNQIFTSTSGWIQVRGFLEDNKYNLCEKKNLNQYKCTSRIHLISKIYKNFNERLKDVA